MKILNLAQCPEYIDIVVNALYGEWGGYGEKNNYNFWNSWVRSSLSTEDIPQTYIAIENDSLVATYSLWRCDLQSRQDLFPWFGGLWVKPEYRSSGIGKSMQEDAINRLRSMCYKKVFLFTEMTGYYEESGWQFIGVAPDEKGDIVRLYQYDL